MNLSALIRCFFASLAWGVALVPVMVCGQLVTEVEIKTNTAAGRFDISHKNYVPPPQASPGWAFIPLPANMEPFQVSRSGTVLLADSNNYYRWQNGVLETLHPKHPAGSIWVNPVNGRNYKYNQTLTAINAAGEIALNFNLYAVWSLSGSRDSYYDNIYLLKKWVPGSNASTEYAGPVFSFTTLSFNLTSVNYLTQKLTLLNALDDTGTLWVQIGDRVETSFEYFGLRDQRLLSKVVRVGPSSEIMETPFMQSDLSTTFQLTGVSANGRAIGSVRTTGFAETTKYYVGDSQVDFQPVFINRNNWLLGRPSSGGAIFVQEPSGVRPPMPIDGYVTWIDDQDRINGVYYRPETGEQVKAVWIRQEGASLSYERKDYYTLRPTSPWTSDHQVAPATTALQVGLMTRPTDTGTETRPFLAVPCAIAVDANRDGEIKTDGSDTTIATNPYRFWLNDDDDTSARITPTVAAETDTVIVSIPDYQRGQIFSKRNLEDFTRLWISMGGLQDALAAGTIQVGLKWKESFVGAPAINIYASADATGSESYLKNDTAAEAQIAGVFNSAIKDKNYKLTVDTNGTFVFTPDFWAGLTTANSKKCLLFEGAGVGFGQLVIVLLDQNGNPIGEGPGVWLDLKNIKSMYERAVATTGGPRSENGVDYTIPLPYSYVGPDPSNIPQPTMGWEPNTLGFPYELDPAETKTYIIYVHGWRWSPEKANNRTETVFKRLWHLSYKGRLAALRWPTFYGGPDDGDDWLAGLSTYNDSEYRAWKSGESLKQYVNQLPNGYTRSIVAHSMGNIVTGSALQKGMAVANYALLNGAIPAMCYDKSSALHQPWNYTTPNDDSDSGTKSMAYTGQLKTLNTNAVNFFLTRDSATTFAWEINNDRFKPQNQIFVECVRGYTYARANPPGTKLFVDFCVSPLRHLIDEDEAMAFACQSLTKTVGAEGRTAGPISSTVDMDTFSFGDSHGAEWDRNFDQTRMFYIQLMRSLQLPLQP